MKNLYGRALFRGGKILEEIRVGVRLDLRLHPLHTHGNELVINSDNARLRNTVRIRDHEKIETQCLGDFPQLVL